MKNIYWASIRVLNVFMAMLMLASCDKFEGDQEVPAYIQIDSIGCVTEYDVEGTASHKIVDAWVWVDDQLIGTFELPAMVPVLMQGAHEVVVRAGIKNNGISNTRVPYPFYSSIVRENFILTPDSISLLNASVGYFDNTVFAWMEDFESPLISIEETTKSDTAIKKTTQDGQVFEGTYSGIIELNNEKSFYEGSMKNEIEIPAGQTPVYLELNYKTTNTFTTGLFSILFSEIIQEPILNITPKEEWNKIYVNYTPIVQRNSEALSFKVFLGSVLQTNLSEGTIIIDNLKLLYRKDTKNE